MSNKKTLLHSPREQTISSPAQDRKSSQTVISKLKGRGRGQGRTSLGIKANQKIETKQTVFVGMSGGVDSSVSALLLKEHGFKVVGVYMKNWSKDLPGMECPWAEDLADAKRVAVRLGIPFEVWDFEKEYFHRVVEYMLDEFKKGNTPNPDIMCNQEIKFKFFYEKARERGADFIATGHYAKVRRIEDDPERVELLRAKDERKDQTYFLYRISNEALAHTLFPIGDMLKPEVKALAEARGLHNAYKKESMGVCFVGEVGMREFLSEYIDSKIGEIREIETDRVLGYHEGVVFYTIGQRHGMDLRGVAGETNDGLPYYVVKKDLKNNILYVSKNLNERHLWSKEIGLKDVVWRKSADNLSQGEEAVLVRLRHRAPLVEATFDGKTLRFTNEIKRPASGQSAVLYQGEVCVGGGIIKDEL
ncbi:MAG: tRNA 2-thiouridine(34) synthase MnmA [Candidatus Saccharibacteria bacterium]|nr:tRNA 2-thiouridine(34) synthase MnmA [Candidatus Saccharibacteria bacterium]